MDTQSIIWYAAIWAFAFSAGISRTVRDQLGRNWVDTLASGLCAGFLGFAAVVIRYGGDSVGSPAALGLAGIIGLAGKEISSVIIRKVLTPLGLTDERRDKDHDKDHDRK